MFFMAEAGQDSLIEGRAFTQLYDLVSDKHRTGVHVNALEPTIAVGEADDLVCAVTCRNDEKELLVTLIPEGDGMYISLRSTGVSTHEASLTPSATIPAEDFDFYANSQGLWLFLNEETVELPDFAAAELRKTVVRSRVIEDLQPLFAAGVLGQKVLQNPDLHVLANASQAELAAIGKIEIDPKARRNIEEGVLDQFSLAHCYDDICNGEEHFVGIAPVDDPDWLEFFPSGYKKYIKLSDEDPVSPRDAYIEFAIDSEGWPLQNGTILCRIDDKQLGSWTTDQGYRWEAAHLDAFIVGDHLEAYGDDASLNYLDAKDEQWVKAILRDLHPVPVSEG